MKQIKSIEIKKEYPGTSITIVTSDMSTDDIENMMRNIDGIFDTRGCL